MKAQHQQVKLDRSQTLTEFIKEDEINLPPGELYNLIDMAVTSDNKLLLCNSELYHHKVYIYKDYKTYEDEISFTSQPWCITVVQHTPPMFILLSFVLLVVLINCMDLSPRRQTTALSVHGTTVIHQG
jgi:hypothetical protein